MRCSILNIGAGAEKQEIWICYWIIILMCRRGQSRKWLSLHWQLWFKYILLESCLMWNHLDIQKHAFNIAALQSIICSIRAQFNTCCDKLIALID